VDIHSKIFPTLVIINASAMYLIGYDIGSSSIKTALIDAQTQETIEVVQFPEQELSIQALAPNWAEQDPEVWWTNLCLGTQKLLSKHKINPADIKGIGIAYQMHGLVLVDKDQQVLRPSIIWCDSRAVKIGEKAFEDLGPEFCLSHYLNSPGNFTASKLKWVKNNEPNLYSKIDKVLLPGDYIAMRLTGQTGTTFSGLSEGIFWDFKKAGLATDLLDYFELEQDYIPKPSNSFSTLGEVHAQASAQTGLAKSTPVTYRAGDQPNNALSLNVLKPGELAASGGTSGVLYGVTDKNVSDSKSRVNGFAHVNYTPDDPVIGLLLCINGAGIQYAYTKRQLGGKELSYPEMEELAAKVGIGSDGLSILPFGNGAERMLNSQIIGSHINNLHFNSHNASHLFRASLEGIAFAFVYGAKILSELSVDLKVIRAGNDNLFQSNIFSSTIATLLNSKIEIIKTTGAIGAAKAAGIDIGIYNGLQEAFDQVKIVKEFIPQENPDPYFEAYLEWSKQLQKQI
jgi:xylulokinase